MPGIRREEFLGIMNRLKCYPKMFVETGTWKGGTLKEAFLCKMFKKLMSIELDEKLFRDNCYPLPESRIVRRESWLECVQDELIMYCGESSVLLPQISEPEPTFFFLDAHWWSELSGITKDTPLPLWKELEYIRGRNKQEVVVVDDIQAFGGVDKRTIVEDWAKVTIDNILAAMPNCLYHYVQNNRLHMRLEER